MQGTYGTGLIVDGANSFVVCVVHKQLLMKAFCIAGRLCDYVTDMTNQNDQRDQRVFHDLNKYWKCCNLRIYNNN